MQFTPGGGLKNHAWIKEVPTGTTQALDVISRVEELIQGEFDGLMPVEDGCRELAW